MKPFEHEIQEKKLDRDKPLILLLGSVSHEGITSALSASGRQYKQKYPESTVNNWNEIIKIFDDFDVAVVLWKLSPGSYRRIASTEYADVVEQLLGLIKQTDYAIYVHTDLLDCDPSLSESSFWNDWPEVEEKVRVKNILESYDLEYLSYTKNAELTVLASKYITDTEHGLLLRLYIPQKRMWSHEAGKVLQLFRDYLEKISKADVRLDQKRTEQGTIYEFYGELIDKGADLSNQFTEFSNFLDICIDYPAKAELLLQNHTIPHAEITGVISRFAKEARRLQVDFKHERERKLLSIRHRMESELTDVIDAPNMSTMIQAIVESVVPAQPGISTLSSLNQAVLAPSVGNTSSPNLTININSHVIQAVRSIVASEINGDVNVTEEDRKIISLIDEYGGDDRQKLMSDANELSDRTAPTPGRLKAKRRLLQFLNALASKAGDVGAGVLQSYIEHKMGI